MKRTRILPLGTREHPRQPDRLLPMQNANRGARELAKVAFAVLILGLLTIAASGAWR